jgi:type I restriction enzyme S subunit
VPGINLGILKRLPVVLPPLTTQRKIAAILSAYDDLIENNNRRIKLLQAIAQRIYREWFVEFRYPGYEDDPFVDSSLGRIPQGWVTRTLGETCSLMQAGGTPSRSNPSYWVGGTIDWFKTTELQDGFLWESTERVTRLAVSERRTRVFPSGAILMAIYGSPTVGRLGVLTQNGACNQAALALVGRDVPQVLLYYILVELRQHFNSIAQGAAQQNISKQSVEETVIALPPAELCRAAEAIIDPLWAVWKTIDLANNRLRATRDLLLPGLVSGKIDVTELEIDTREGAA